MAEAKHTPEAVSAEEAQQRILFLSAGLALTRKEIASRWPEWHAQREAVRQKHGLASNEVLFWGMGFAAPAYEALGIREPRTDHSAKATGGRIMSAANLPLDLDALEKVARLAADMLASPAGLTEAEMARRFSGFHVALRPATVLGLIEALKAEGHAYEASLAREDEWAAQFDALTSENGELLAALKDLYVGHDRINGAARDAMFERARAAIAKAEGRS